MPKPAAIPTWATDATFADPGETWNGDPTKVDPGAAKQAQGWVPTEEVPAEFLNYLDNLRGQWAAWLDELFDANGDHSYPTTQNRATVIHASSGFGAAATGAGGFRHEVFGTAPNQGYRLTSEVNRALLLVSLEAHLPQGAIVSDIEAVVEPGNARSVGNRVALWWFREEMGVEPGSETFGGFTGPTDETEDDGTTDYQVIRISGLAIEIRSHTFDVLGSESYWQNLVALRAGDDAGSNRDNFHALIVRWTDPGLRNY